MQHLWEGLSFNMPTLSSRVETVIVATREPSDFEFSGAV